MDKPEIPSDRFPPQELQRKGPRPTLLKVRKDSHKIIKPSVAPSPAAEAQSHRQPPMPVIIYTFPPKIIHVKPDEFKSLVQRLTGINSSSIPNTSPPSKYASSSAVAFQENSSGISPAERSVTMEFAESRRTRNLDQSIGMMEGTEIQQFPEILPPNPGTIQPKPQNFFPSSSKSNPHLHGSMNENNLIMPSLILPHMMNRSSPKNVDIFSTLFDL